MITSQLWRHYDVIIHDKWPLESVILVIKILWNLKYSLQMPKTEYFFVNKNIQKIINQGVLFWRFSNWVFLGSLPSAISGNKIQTWILYKHFSSFLDFVSIKLDGLLSLALEFVSSIWQAKLHLPSLWIFFPEMDSRIGFGFQKMHLMMVMGFGFRSQFSNVVMAWNQWNFQKFSLFSRRVY